MNPLELEPGAIVPEVAVFPLPQVVLFPGALMPLHVFEPRYREMTRDALESTRLLVVAHIPDDRKENALGQPLYCPLSTLGRIVRHDRLPDGRYNILVEGLCRVELDELPFERAYRRARATVLPTLEGKPDPAEAHALSITASTFANRVRDSHPEFDFSLDDGAAPGRLADRCAHYLVLDANERQRLLEITNDADRVSACLEILMRQGADLGPRDTLH